MDIEQTVAKGFGVEFVTLNPWLKTAKQITDEDGTILGWFSLEFLEALQNHPKFKEN